MNNITTRGPFIDGFAIDCGDEKRVIKYKDDIYIIGCWEGTYDEAVEDISEKYTGEARDAYIAKLQDTKDMLWLSDELYEQLATHEDWEVRLAVAEYSDRYHEQLKDDEVWYIRKAVAKYSDRYHEQLKDDEHWIIRGIVAVYSDKYHEQLKDDPDENVRIVVSNYKKGK